MAARQFIERVFNRGLNLLSPRSLVGRGQSIICANMELLANSVRRRLGKYAAYRPPAFVAGTDNKAISALARFYHLSSAGVLKATWMAYHDRMYVTSTDFSDTSPALQDKSVWTRLYPPNAGSSAPWDDAPTLPDEFGTSLVSFSTGNIKNAVQSRQWLYIQSEYGSSDSANAIVNIPIRTACNVAPTVGNDYDNNSFAHGLYPPLALLVADTEHSPVPDSSEWIGEQSIATATADGVGGSQCVRRDSAGNVHVVFVDDASDDPFHTYRNPAGTWSTPVQIDAVTLSQNFGALSLIIDEDDNLHVSYYDSAGGDLYYAISEDTGATWTAEAVVTTNDVGAYNSIILTKNQMPGILYYNVTSADLWYIEKTGDGSWEGPGAAIDSSSADVGKFVVAETDSTGKIHAVYEDTTNTNPRYITRAAGTLSDGAWASGADITTSGAWVGPTAISINSDDNPGCVFSIQTGSFLPTLWSYDGSTWSSSGTPDSSSVAPSVAMDFDPSDDSNVAHIFYLFNTGASDPIYYANNSTGAMTSASFPAIFTSTDKKVIGCFAIGTRVAVATAGAGSGLASGEFFYVDRSSYYYKVTAEYDDGKLGESGPSAATLISYDGDVKASNAKTVALLNSATANYYRMARDVTKMHVYRTVKGSASDGIYYRVGSVTCTYTSGTGIYAIDSDLTDNVPDSDLVGNAILDEDVFMPPKYKTACFWKDRMVIGHLKARDTSATEGTELDLEDGGYHPNRLRFSRANLPDVFPANFFIDIDIGGGSATVRKLIVNKRIDALMAFLEDYTVIVPSAVVVGKLADAIVTPAQVIPSADGTASPGSVVSDGEGNVFAWTKTGIQVFEGASARYISENTVKPLWNMLDSNHPSYTSRINMAQLALVEGVYVPGEEKILWAYPAVNSTYNNFVLVLDLRRWRETGRRDGVFHLYTVWQIGKWMVWHGEGDRSQLFGAEANAALGPWIYRCLFGNNDQVGTFEDVAATTAQITSQLHTGAFDFGRPDRIRKFRNIVMNGTSKSTNIAVGLDIDGGTLVKSLGTWSFDYTTATGEVKHLVSGIPRACIGTHGALNFLAVDTTSPEPWELYSVGIEVEELPSRVEVGT